MNTVAEEWVIIGKVLKTHGLKGGLKVASYTDIPGRFQQLEQVILEASDGRRAVGTLSSVRELGAEVILGFKEIISIEDAQAYVHGWVKVPQSEVAPLPENSYYHNDLIGMEVSFEEGELLGAIEAIIETGSNDVWAVRKDGKEVLIPAIRQVIKEVDLQQKRVILFRVEGLV